MTASTETAANEAPPPRPSLRSATLIVVVGGTVAAVLDIAYAFTVWALAGVGPLVILQVIASGVLGRAAFAGGASTAALGCVLHWLMALAMAAAYVAASMLKPVLLRRPLVFGPLYGLALYAVMDWIVVPLSAVPTGPAGSLTMTLGQVAAHIFLVGLPIALIASRLGGRPRKA